MSVYRARGCRTGASLLVLAIATGMLSRPPDAEDAAQETFARMAVEPAQNLDDRRGWLLVVTRHSVWAVLPGRDPTDNGHSWGGQSVHPENSVR